MTSDLPDAFYTALAFRESSGNPKAVNSLGFMGLYQMGRPALQDVEYMNSQGEWTGKDGINSREDFLNNATIQTKAIRAYHSLVWNRYLPAEVRAKVGSTIKGVKLTKCGLIGGAHLVGHVNLKNFVMSNGENDTKDGYGTTCSEYVKKFSAY